MTKALPKILFKKFKNILLYGFDNKIELYLKIENVNNVNGVHKEFSFWNNFYLQGFYQNVFSWYKESNTII